MVLIESTSCEAAFFFALSVTFSYFQQNKPAFCAVILVPLFNNRGIISFRINVVGVGRCVEMVGLLRHVCFHARCGKWDRLIWKEVHEASQEQFGCIRTLAESNYCCVRHQLELC